MALLVHINQPYVAEEAERGWILAMYTARVWSDRERAKGRIYRTLRRNTGLFHPRRASHERVVLWEEQV